MTTAELLRELRNRGVRIWAEQGRLCYDAARGVVDDAILAELRSHKAELLGRLNRAQASMQLPALKPATRDDPLPLSFAQQRLWFLEQLNPEGTQYNIVRVVRLTGELNVGALERSLGEIVRRHEALRTHFVLSDKSPVQAIAPAPELKLRIEDLRHLDHDAQTEEVARLGAAEYGASFDLENGPLFRFKLLELDDKRHVLLLALHHIVADGWSMGILFRELGSLYDSFLRGEPHSLPELAIQYADYSVWQRKSLQGEVLSKQLDYWRGDLQSVQTLELPLDHPRPAAQTYCGGAESLSIDEDMAAALHRLGREEGVTLFMTLLAAFQALLHRCTGQDDIAVGSPVANRDSPGIEELIGFFVNMVVMRTKIERHMTFRELLAKVRDVALGAYSHQSLPFERLVEELQPDRDVSLNPLFQATFALEEETLLGLGDLTVELVAISPGTTHFDLELVARPAGHGLVLECMYNTDLFESATVRRLLGQLRVLLAGAVADPDAVLGTLPLTTPVERRRILTDWRGTVSDYPREATVHHLFERQAERSADATAVLFGDEELSYGELNSRANRVANYLRALGVGPNVVVGLCIERGVEMIVGMLGILKAGGAYAPLDPEYPAARLEYMISDTRAPVLLTQSQLADRLPKDDARVVCLDSDWPAIAEQSPESPRCDATGASLAYVIYTSGSTGQPKGTSIPHRAINRLVCNSDYVQLQASDRVAHVSNASFDAATFEIWGPLLNGGCVVGIDRDVSLSPERFASALRELGVTTLFLTTALFNQMARAVPGAFQTLRHLLFGGEACAPDCVRSVLESAPPERLLHVYGPTENTTFSTWHLVLEVPEGAVTVPIGTPISNTTAYILDDRMEPVAVGVPGELYTGGDGLAVEYLNQPELTAEKFVSDPFSEDPLARLYRTGDLCRWREDGTIEFLARRDSQVKIRGFRIELGEIEHVLNEYGSVSQAVVVVREDQPSDRCLVAYVVPGRGDQPDISALRSYVQQKLPQYMTPSAFVILDALPLNPNGKVDRKTLPPADSQRQVSEPFVVPRTEMERRLAEIWREILGIERIGVRDNFFDLGGHSLLLAQLRLRIVEQLGQAVSMVELFGHPTLKSLAEFLSRDEHENVDHGVDEALLESVSEGRKRQARLLARRRRSTSGERQSPP